MNKVFVLVLVVATVSAFPTENNPQVKYNQGRHDLESQEPVKIVPVVVLTEGGILIVQEILNNFL